MNAENSQPESTESESKTFCRGREASPKPIFKLYLLHRKDRAATVVARYEKDAMALAMKCVGASWADCKIVGSWEVIGFTEPRVLCSGKRR